MLAVEDILKVMRLKVWTEAWVDEYMGLYMDGHIEEYIPLMEAKPCVMST